MFERLKRLFLSEDEKPVMLGFVLARDTCSRLLSDFNDHDLADCEKLILIKLSESGAIETFSSENTSVVEAIGLLRLAEEIIRRDCDEC